MTPEENVNSTENEEELQSPDEGGKKSKDEVRSITITRPEMQIAQFICQGSSYLCINRVSAKVKESIKKSQAEGGAAKSRKTRGAKDFEQLFKDAAYHARDGGWYGIHAACIRNAAISACRTVGYKMTVAKLGIFTKADGYDRVDGTPLIRIWGADPEMWVAPVRNADGSFDLRSRPRWEPGTWEIRPRIRFDAGLFTLSDVSNLIMRIGLQVGIGEGRPDSKKSAGLEYGLFDLVEDASIQGEAA